MMESDDESVKLVVQMPKEERNKITAVISSWEFQVFQEAASDVRLYFCASEHYIRNLINRRETPKHTQEVKRKFPSGTIIFQSFTCNIKVPNGKDQYLINYEGQLCIIYQQQKKALELNLKLSGQQQPFDAQDYIAAKFLFSQKDGQNPKTHLQRLEYEGETWTSVIQEADFQKYLKSRLAFEVLIQRQNIVENKFVGIHNNGNTCYMNSILQILYFIRVLRQHIMKYDHAGRVVNALKQVMFSLMYNSLNNKEPIDAQVLIQAYGKFSQYPRRQQDTQEFLLGFLEDLQAQDGSLAELWQGECVQVLQSIQKDKPYTSRILEDFNGLEVPLQDLKGNTFANLIQAIRHLLDKQRVDDKIESDEYGKIAVEKSRQFTKLPPVLFITLKRYKFKKGSQRPVKILADLSYPEKINLGFLLDTPTGDDYQYILFAVTIHRGQHHSSGHYYSYVNTSINENQPYWVKFDDRRVLVASRSQALSFSGGKRKTIIWDKEYQRFREKDYVMQDTGYVLVYYRKALFRKFQSYNPQIPAAWMQQAIRLQRQPSPKKQQYQGMFTVHVHVAYFNLGFEPFGDINKLIPLNLKLDEDVVKQIKNLDPLVLGCEIGSVWKVNKQTKRIKHITQYADLPQTVERVFTPKLGHRIPDYLLLIPADVKIYLSNQHPFQPLRLGLIRQTLIYSKTRVETAWRVIEKVWLEQFKSDQEDIYRLKAHVELKDAFVYDWNDYCILVYE